MKTSDKVVIEISLERNENGTVSRSVNIVGEGFHYFELIGLLQICAYEFSIQSMNTAKELPQDQLVRIKWTNPEPPQKEEPSQ